VVYCTCMYVRIADSPSSDRLKCRKRKVSQQASRTLRHCLRGPKPGPVAGIFCPVTCLDACVFRVAASVAHIVPDKGPRPVSPPWWYLMYAPLPYLTHVPRAMGYKPSVFDTRATCMVYSATCASPCCSCGHTLVNVPWATVLVHSVLPPWTYV
jgi:hypothetical protein